MPSSPPSPASADEPGPAAPTDVPRRRFAALVLVTLACVAGLGRTPILETVANTLTGEAEVVVTPPLDAEAWDGRRGNAFLKSVEKLAPLPKETRRVVFLGNSQQYTVPPPRGGAIPIEEATRITSMRLAASLEATKPGAYRVYNGACDNQNFGEALWQSLFWLEVAPSPPALFVVQASFDTLRKTGVRAGYQTLLADPRFAAAIDGELASEARPYHADFRAAVAAFRERAREERTASTSAEWQQWSPEPWLRDRMRRVPLYRDRELHKGFFLASLYALRVRALGISPRSRRHISGAPLEQNLAALERLLARAKDLGSKVVVYHAPSNPAVDMFYADELAQYRERLATICAVHGATFLDLEKSVPPEHWGALFDGPDPIHFDARGHAIVHERLLPTVRERLEGVR